MVARQGAKPQNRHRTPHGVAVRKVAHDVATWAGLAQYFYQRRKGRPRADHTAPATMADLSRFLIIDSASGTVLCADQCYLVDDNALSPQQWEDMDSMSDAEVCDMARQHGRKLSDVVTLRPTLPGESPTA